MIRRVDGEEDVIRALRRFRSDVQERVAREVQRDGRKAVAEVRRRAPRGPTGRLKRSIKRRTSKDKLSVQISVSPKIAPHGHLVEFGHGGRAPAPPHPFFYPPLETAADKLNAGIKLAVNVAGARFNR